MLTIPGPRVRYCDGVSRRSFLQIGGLVLGGLALSDLFRAEARAGAGPSRKSIIMVYLSGGLAHQDSFDLKPGAPREVRGEFNPIDTNVPGIQICELFPRMAAMMDKFIVVRSLSDSEGAHDAYQCMTGRRKGERSPPGGWPAGGAWVSKMQGPVRESVPPHIALMYQTGNRTWGEPGTGGFLGVGHSPFNTLGREARSTSDNMVLQGVTLERLQDRVALGRGAFGDSERGHAEAPCRLASMALISRVRCPPPAASRNAAPCSCSAASRASAMASGLGRVRCSSAS